MTQDSSSLDIAIIGLSLRLPGSDDPEQLWRNLSAGVESVKRFSPADGNGSANNGSANNGHHNTDERLGAGGLLDGMGLFDAELFGYNHREAQIIDPQHRLFLECSWQALEQAGYDPRRFDGAIGVFAGAGGSQYAQNVFSHPELVESLGEARLQLSLDKDHLATRVAYKLDLRGPAVTVQTACSTSLVAIHLACQSLLSGESDMALAGGSSLNLRLDEGYRPQDGDIRSIDGRCRAFDAQASGTVSGSGVVVVALKPLRDALEDGDRVHAVIKSSAINNDGARKMSYTAPSVEGQAAVVSEALAVADIDPATVGYVEAHGTATDLGDPIEVTALTQAFRERTDQRAYCGLGSIKTNIGHLDAAAGAAGLAKAIVALKHRALPPSLHFEAPNPKIDFESSPFYVARELRPWQNGSTPRRAGVSSFGLGGTNAHLVIEEAPEPEARTDDRSWQLLPLSAATETALEELTRNLGRHLAPNSSESSLADVAFTLQVGRQQLKHRRVVVGRDRADVASALATADPRRLHSGQVLSTAPDVVFLFPGMGSQTSAMGAELHAAQPVFREELNRCFEILGPELGGELRSVFLSTTGAGRMSSTEAKPESRLRRPSRLMPYLFAVEYALARLWLSWNVTPRAMIGHSLGEYVAACVAEVFDLETALHVVAERGRLVEQMPAGTALSIDLPVAAVRRRIGEDLAIAALNHPAQCTVSGPDAQIRRLAEELTEEGVESRVLPLGFAVHSPLLDPVIEPFERFVAEHKLKAPRIPFVSNVTGTWIRAEEATSPAYWARHLRSTVRFAEGLTQILDSSDDQILLEVGPGRALGRFARHIAAEQSKTPQRKTSSPTILASLPHARDPRSEAEVLLTTLGQLWLSGFEIDWLTAPASEKPRRVELPTYPFERQHFWIERADREPAKASRPSNGFAVSSSSSDERSDDSSSASRLFVPGWRRVLPRAKPGVTEGSWLVFLLDSGSGEALARHRIGEGGRVIRVLHGERFERSAPDRFRVRGDDRDDLMRLFADLRESGEELDRVIFTSSAFTDAGEGADACLRLLFQVLAEQAFEPSPSLIAITSGAQTVDGTENATDEEIALAALVEDLALQYPNPRALSIDLPSGEETLNTAQIKAVADEIARGDESGVALRGLHFWRPEFESLNPESLTPVAETSVAESPLAETPETNADGTWLVTAGLEGYGFQIARHLADMNASELVLTDPWGLPPREQWQNWLEGEEASIEAEFQHVEATLIERWRVAESPQEAEVALDAVCASYLYEYLDKSDVDLTAGAKISLTDLRQQLSVVPQLERFLDFSLRVLEEDGILRRQAEDVEFTDARRPTPADELHARLLERWPSMQGRLELLGYCARHLPEALSGSVEAVGILHEGVQAANRFAAPDASPERPSQNLCVNLVREFVLRAARSGRPLRLLEVGGGAGVLTRGLVRDLADFDVEYHFTDLGRSFVIQAQRLAKQWGLDFLHCSQLDLSRDPEAQGFDASSFDMILALNVVHATPQVEESLAHLRRLLKPEGLLWLIESMEPRRWVDMTSGLSEQWWHFADAPLRERSPLLGLEAWQGALTRQGFSEVRSFPQGQERAETGLLLARPTSVDAGQTDWLAEIAKAERNRVRNAIDRVRDLEATGATIRVRTAEISDPLQAEVVAAEIGQEAEPVRGVIHAEPLLSHRTATDPFSPRALSHYALGARALDRLWRTPTPDVFLLFAPLPTSGRSGGRVEAAIAEAVVRRREREGLGSGTAVQWNVEEGELDRATLQNLLWNPLQQVMVTSAPPERRALDLTQSPSSDPAPGVQDISDSSQGPDNDTERQIARIWEELLGVSPIRLDDDLFALNGDSLTAVQVISRVRDLFQVKIALKDLFEAPTVRALAARVSRELEERRQNVESHELESLLAELESLSPEEIARDLDLARQADGSAG